MVTRKPYHFDDLGKNFKEVGLNPRQILDFVFSDRSHKYMYFGPIDWDKTKFEPNVCNSTTCGYRFMYIKLASHAEVTEVNFFELSNIISNIGGYVGGIMKICVLLLGSWFTT